MSKKDWMRRAAAMAVVPALLLAACGDDDDDGVAADGDDETTEEYCAHAREMDESEDFPTDEQLERYKELAPEEIRADAEALADALIGRGPEAFGDIFADEDLTASLERIEEYEAEECGLDTGPELPDGVTQEVDEDAQRVDVSAVDYDFIFDAPPSGHVSFVMTNDGDEPHFMGIAKLAEGVTMEEALEADDPEDVTELIADSDVVGPGGEAALTFEDLEAGEYAMVCFIPDAEGTPHAFLGMAVPFTVQ